MNKTIPLFRPSFFPGTAVRFGCQIGLVAIACAVLLSVPSAKAADTWNGGGGDDNWSTALNWDTGVPEFPAALTFDGTTRLSSINDLSSLTVTGFTFGGSAGAFVITGNAITLGGDMGFAANPATARSETINLAMDLSATRTVATQANGNVVLGGVLSGTGGLIKTGTGNLTLGATNTYTGGTSILGQNNVVMGANNALGTGSLTIGDNSGGNARLFLNGYNQTVTGLTIGATLGTQGAVIEAWGIQGGTVSTITFQIDSGTSSTNAATYLRNGAASGFDPAAKLALVKTGAGTLDVSLLASSGYTGGLTVNGGTLTYSSTATTAGLGGGDITLGGGTLNYSSNGSVTINRTIALTDATSSTLNNAAGTVTVSSVISGSGNLTKSGAGTLVLSGVNTFSGGLTLNSGTVRIANDSAVGTGMLTLNGGAFAANTAAQNRNISNNMTISGDVVLGDTTLNSTLTCTGTVNLGAAMRTLTISNTQTQFSAVTGTGGIIKEGAGILKFQAGTTFSGGLTLNNGAVLVNDGAGLGTGTLTLNGGNLATSGGSARILANAVVVGGDVVLGQATTNTGSLTLSGSMDLGAAARTFNVLVPTQLSGIISSSAGGGIVKNGAGTLTLSRINTFSGGTSVNAGTLLLSAGDINATSELSVAAGATFTNNSPTAFNKALLAVEGAVLSGTGSFAPTSLTLTAHLADGFTTLALGTTSLTKAGNLELTLTGVTTGDYTIFSGSALAGTFSTMTIGGVSLTDAGGGDFSGLVSGANYAFTNATNLLVVTPVPEPSTWALLALAGGCLMALRRRR
jgi:autotransporter-associated beta strand protein